MASQFTIWREPSTFAVGDTMLFERRLSKYQATNGWSLLYELRGGIQPISFASVADGENHSITVPASVTVLWQPGDYILTGYAINMVGNSVLGIAAGERHQIYYADLPVTPNSQTLPGDAPVTTFYQRMVTGLQALLESSLPNDIITSVVEGTKFERMTRAQLSQEYATYYNLRQNEIDQQRAASGQISRNRIRPVMKVIYSGPNNGTGPSWPFNASV